MPFIIDARNMGGGSIGSAAGGDTSTGTRNNVTLAAPWDESKEYLKGDLATNNGDLYQAQKSVPAGVKISDEDYWALVVAGDKSKETEQLRKDIGSLGDLETESKDNLVDAINEANSIRPDWNQNDETKKDYIKGRTHYTYKERKTLYENNAISSSPIKLNDNPFSLEVGKTYIVEFDGIEYKIICKSYNGRSAYIGNLYFGTHNANLDSGEPFYIDDMLIYVELGSGTHSILLMQNVEAVHTLDPKYIEDMYYTKTIPGNTPLCAFDASEGKHASVELAFPLVVGSEYNLTIDGDSYGGNVAIDNGNITLNCAHGVLTVEPHNPLLGRWDGNPLKRHIEIAEYNHKIIKQIDPKYLPEYNVEGYELDKILELVKSGAKCYVLDEFGNRLYYAGTKASSSGSSASSSSSSSSSTAALPNIVFAGVVNDCYKTVEYRLSNWGLVRIQAIPLFESILYTEQGLTDEQKAQARDNIGAAKDNGVIYLDSPVTSTKIVQAIIENPKSIIQCLITYMGSNMMFLPHYQLFRGSGYRNYLGYAIGNYDVQNSKDIPFDVYLYTATSDLGLYKIFLTPMHANKSILDSITGIVTANKLTSPDHPTDLIAYDAFQAAVPLVQSMNLTGAQVGQTIKVKAVNEQGMPTAWEAADMSADEQWELLGTLDASTGDVLQLDFSNPVKKLYFYSSLCDTAGEQYSASTTVYRQVAFKVGDTWRDVNSFKIGCCKHNWRWKTRYWLECGANLPYPKGEWTETLSAGNVAIKLTPLEINNNNQYSSGLVSGIRFSLVLPDGTENTASGTIKVWGVKA